MVKFNSTIFRTIKDEATGANKSIGLFGKSFTELKDILSSVKTNGLFKTSIVNDSDIECIKTYNDAIARNVPHQQAMEQATKGASATTAQMIKNANGNTIALDKMTLGAKAASAAMKALSVVGNMAVMYGISKVVEGIQYLGEENERYIESQQEVIEKTEEQIAKYDDEIKSLTNLQDKLVEAKDNKKKLAEIQNDLNNAIGQTPGLLNGESDAWSVANQKIIDRIALLEKLREEELNKNIQSTKNIYDNQIVENDWGYDEKVEDYFSTSKEDEDTRKYLKEQGEEIPAWLKGYDDLVNDYLKQLGKDDSKSFSEIVATHMQDNMYEGVVAHLPTADELQSYFNKQYSLIAPLFSEYISDLETVLPNETLDDIIEQLVYVNPSDAVAVETQFKEFIDALDKKGIGELYNEYLESLLNNDINSEELYNQLISSIDELIELYPYATNELNSFIDTIGIGVSSIGNSVDDLANKTSIPFLEAFNKTDFKEHAEKLLDLARSGELTKETLTSTEEYATLLEDTGLSAQQVKGEILDMLTATEKLSVASNTLDSLAKAFEEAGDKGFVTASTINSLPETFKELDNFNVFESIVSNSKSGTEAIQDAFNDLVTEWLAQNNTFKDVTEEQTNMFIANLYDMGIVNAQENILETLSAKQTYYNKALESGEDITTDLNEATVDEIASLINEGAATDEATRQMIEYWIAKNRAEGTLLDTSKDVKQLSNLVKALGLTTKYLDAYAYWQEQYENSEGTYQQSWFKHHMDLLQSDMEAELEAIYDPSNYNVDFDPEEVLNKTDKDSSSNTYFDWIETKLGVLREELENVKETAEDAFSGWDVREDAYDTAIAKTQKLIQEQEKARKEYEKEANKSGLSSSHIDLVQKGAIDIDKLSNDDPLKEQIESYQEWYEKVKDCDEEILELNKDLAELYRDSREFKWEQFETLAETISRITEEVDFLKELLSDEDMFDDNGNMTKYADATMGLHFANIETYKKLAQDYYEEIQKLQEQINNGTVDESIIEKYREYEDAHRDMITSIRDEQNAILDLVSQGYDEQISALERINDLTLERMDKERDLYNYQKSIAEKTKEKTSLERQISVLDGDNSEESKSRIQKLRLELENVTSDIEELEYEKQRSDTESMLTKLTDDLKLWQNQRMDDEAGLLEGIRGEVETKSDEIMSTLKEVATEYGTTLSTSLTDIFGSEKPFDSVVTAINNLITKLSSVVSIDDSGNNGSSTNNTPQTPTTTTSSQSTTQNTSSSNKNYDDIFIHKTYSKKDLDPEHSLVDYLKNKDIQADFQSRAMYWSKIFGGTYTGSTSQNRQFMQWLKSNGYKNGTRYAKKGLHWTQEDGEELIIRTTDGAILTPLKWGDKVVNAEGTNNLYDFANDPKGFLASMGLNYSMPAVNVKVPDVSALKRNNTAPSVNLGGVHIAQVVTNDAQDFMRQLPSIIANDTKTQKVISEVVLGGALGHNSMNARRLV